jgi:hypothetical protein
MSVACTTALLILSRYGEQNNKKDLGQLGGVYYVFAGATGRRFEHSLGVAHLARKFVRRLRDNQVCCGNQTNRRVLLQSLLEFSEEGVLGFPTAASTQVSTINDQG